MVWVLHLRKRVKKIIGRFPKNDQRRIIEILRQMEQNPFFGDIVKLEDGDNLWRRRIGAYRIFYECTPNRKIIYVFKVKRRTSKTY